MEDGGLVVMSAPANPFRCPPGPFERACLIARYLKSVKPRSKLIVLDAKDKFRSISSSRKPGSALYPGLLEWAALSTGGKVSRSIPRHGRSSPTSRLTRPTSTTSSRRSAPGRIAELAGVADRSAGARSTRSPSIDPAARGSTSSATPRLPAPCQNRPSPPTLKRRSAPTRLRRC